MLLVVRVPGPMVLLLITTCACCAHSMHIFCAHLFLRILKYTTRPETHGNILIYYYVHMYDTRNLNLFPYMVIFRDWSIVYVACCPTISINMITLCKQINEKIAKFKCISVTGMCLLSVS